MTNYRLIYARFGKIATTHALADRAAAERNANVGVGCTLASTHWFATGRLNRPCQQPAAELLPLAPIPE